MTFLLALLVSALSGMAFLSCAPLPPPTCTSSWFEMQQDTPNMVAVPYEFPAAVKVIACPASPFNAGRDWEVRMESEVELQFVKVGFVTLGIYGYEFVGCEGTDCDLPVDLLGPTIDRSKSFAVVHPSLLYVKLYGNLSADSYLGEHTLLHISSPPVVNQVVLGVLRVPGSMAHIPPTFSLAGVSPKYFDVPYYEGTPFPGGWGGEESEDVDNDDVSNDIDNCVTVFNPNQIDEYGPYYWGSDGLGDLCQPITDSDGDGAWDMYDNCLYVPNSNQADSNVDGYGDACSGAPTGPSKLACRGSSWCPPMPPFCAGCNWWGW